MLTGDFVNIRAVNEVPSIYAARGRYDLSFQSAWVTVVKHPRWSVASSSLSDGAKKILSLAGFRYTTSRMNNLCLIQASGDSFG